MRPLYFIVAFLALLGSVTAFGALPTAGGSPIPPQAMVAGYFTNTFSTNSMFNSSTVDASQTYSRGFQWYFWNFMGFMSNPTSTTFNSDGSVTTQGGYANGQLVSIAKIATAPYFVGTAFGGGGYFEAEISFDPGTVDMSIGHPSWWMMSSEHLIGDIGDQWAGQASGYVHFIEVDAFEYDIDNGTTNVYAAALPEYWGLWASTCPSICTKVVYHIITTPQLTDWKIYHRLGMLWIPATGASKGSVTFYFDDIPHKSYSYSEFSKQSPPSTDESWTFGVIDQQHLALIFGSNSGPMTVRSLNVWQVNATRNITN